jgi:hypothetical protein
MTYIFVKLFKQDKIYKFIKKHFKKQLEDAI